MCSLLTLIILSERNETYAEKADFLDAVREDSVFFTGANSKAGKFITLSTCDVSRRNGRVAVVGELVQ